MTTESPATRFCGQGLRQSESARPCVVREWWLFGAVALLSAWPCVALEVSAQEAYYWSYAQHPDLSYFDHPPMVAWLISAGTRLFGNGAVGIRAATWVAACATTWLGLLLLRDFGIDRGGRIVWIVGSVAVPALATTHFLANPDPPLTLFWILCLLLLWRTRSGAISYWIGAGAAAGCALLSKYTAGFLAVGGIVLLLLDSQLRRQLRRPGPYLGVATAALVFLPVLLWNLDHDFASIRFQTAHRYSNLGFSLRWLLQCIGGQVLMVNPVFLLLLPAMLAWLWQRSRHGDPRALWLLAFGLPLPACFLANSLWMQVKINWFTPAYAVLMLGGALWWRESGWLLDRPRRHSAARVAAWITAGLLLAVPLLRWVPPLGEFPWSGWRKLAARAEYWEDVIDTEDGIEGNVFFFATSYKAAAVTALHLQTLANEVGDKSLFLEPIMAENVVGRKALQFDYWELLAAHVGQDAILIVERPERPVNAGMVDAARERFRSVDLAEHVRITHLGIEALHADVFVCRGYKGPDAAFGRGTDKSPPGR